MANSGKSNINVVKSVIADLNFFSGLIKSEGAKMQREAEGLSSYWKDKQYSKFLSYINELVGELNKSADDLELCANNLENSEMRIYK